MQGRQQQAKIHNRKQEVLRLITCAKQMNPLNFRSFKQVATNRIPSKQGNCRSRAKLEVQSEYSTVRLNAQLRDKARATLGTSGLLLDVAQGTS